MNKNKEFYLDDYSMEDLLKQINYQDNDYQDNDNQEIDNQDNDYQDNDNQDNDNQEIDNQEIDNQEIDNQEIDNHKPSFTIKPNYNSKGEKVVVFSINIPLKKNGLKIDILINNEIYKNMGKYLK
jgi:hypothetical protein